MVKVNCSVGRFIFTLDNAEAYKNAYVIFIWVGTQEKEDGSANLYYIYAAAEQIAQNVEKDCLVVIKSTVPIINDYDIKTISRQL
ncbi:hypothetical protein [Clostridium thermarum]|uniref:hypothetical protein n=1 Tax=Clostridium thermarum TaxID=1716543 RepID=UPI0013D1AC54|nr:hypothetical protein [Clostridium thermarum]